MEEGNPMYRSRTATRRRVVEWPAELGGCESGSESQAVVRFEAVERLVFPVDLAPESEPVVEHPMP